MFTTSSSINVSGQLEKLVNSLVLGTSVARLLGSSPRLPTKQCLSVYNRGYNMIHSDTVGTKGVLVVIGFSIHASLRNYHTLFSNAQVKNTIGIACVFLKYQPLHLCISFVYNCILAIVSIHTCNIKKEKCSRYVRHFKSTTNRLTKTIRRTS